MDITWFSDGATHYAYVDKTYTGYWVVGLRRYGPPAP